MKKVARTAGDPSDKQWLLVSDVDGTLLGDDAALTELLAALADAGTVRLALNSSRPLASVRRTLADLGLGEALSPVAIIGAMGTEIEIGGRAVDTWSLRFESWRRQPVDELMRERGYEPHDDEFQTRFKASFRVPRSDWGEVRAALARSSQPTLVIGSGDSSLDVLPRGAGKGPATAFLAATLGIADARLVAAGDSLNDAQLFTAAGQGIAVANSEPELLERLAPGVNYRARTCHAAGILEGLRHFGALPASSRARARAAGVDSPELAAAAAGRAAGADAGPGSAASSQPAADERPDSGPTATRIDELTTAPVATPPRPGLGARARPRALPISSSAPGAAFAVSAPSSTPGRPGPAGGADQRGSILMLSLHGYVAAEPELGKPDTGGQVTFVLELARCFAELGYKVDIVTRGFQGQPEYDVISPRLRVWRIPFGGPDFVRKEDMHDVLDEFVANLLAAIDTHALAYDVVNSHYWDAGWAGQLVAERLRIPHVHTPHSLGAWKRQEMVGQLSEGDDGFRFEERIHKEFLVYRRCDHVIATTHQQVDVLRDEYGLSDEHMTMLPPGMDERRFTPVPPNELLALRRKLGFRPTDVYAVGRAATNKGYDLLIRSLPALRELVPNASLRLAVGADSPQDKRLVTRWRKLAAEQGVDEHVHWLGYVEEDAMPDHYRAGGVFALPSRYEPFGMTAIEAMACGTPTVVTVHGGLHELIDFGEQALFADPKRPGELAAMLSLPLRYERIRTRLSMEGARFARRHFGWSGIARRTTELFESFRGRYRKSWRRRGGDERQHPTHAPREVSTA